MNPSKYEASCFLSRAGMSAENGINTFRDSYELKEKLTNETDK
jgi:NAD-dependent SIR2 family protein deacetylase